jgi:hypothetical protein
MKNRMLKIACQPEMSRWVALCFSARPIFRHNPLDGFLKQGAQSSRKNYMRKYSSQSSAQSAWQILKALQTVSFCERYLTHASLAEENKLVFMGLRGAGACFLRSQNAKK